MAVELTIQIDSDGNVFTALSGEPHDIAQSYAALDAESPVAAIVKNLLDRSTADTKGGE